MNTYIQFSNYIRPILRAENPRLNSREIIAETTRIWNGLTHEQKMYFMEMGILNEQINVQRNTQRNTQRNVQRTFEDKLLGVPRSSEICPICMGKLNKQDEFGLSETIDIVKPVNCRHKFHKECILNWARQQNRRYLNRPAIECPICRTLSFGKKYKSKRKSKRKLHRTKTLC